MRLSRPLLAVLLLAALAGAASAALPIPPPPDRRINDYAGVLSGDERKRLEDTLRARERESSNQIVVAVFRSLQGESLEDYSIRLAQAWRVGQKGLDNGVIFLVFLDDRKMRLEVGYGLESKLTDALASQILRQVVAPPFREGKVADGIAAGLDAIQQAIAGTYKAAPQDQAARARGFSPVQLMLLLIVVGGIFSIVISALYGSHIRRQGWTGGRRGWGGPIIFPGGGWGSGGSGGGGGGDFGGGGGGFGGGGASGDW
ncbi:MAG: TPM domain-containing protein [Candidatus Rokubacteria bacterium]|nr:TPM domain-containing protein [Candidatus Rokubacteria bacterium]